MQLPSTVHNHFRTVRLFKEQELGRGSFATVCRAQCDDLPCAAKVLHAGFFDQQDPDPGEDTFIARFVEECKILPGITHPNIVQCFGTYQDPDTDLPVLMMELMDESLTNYIEHFRDPLPYHTEVCFSYDVALGLSYLHSRGYVHRDLSSNNVLIMAGARAKITDFGMCRAMTGPSYRQTRLTLCPGTHSFMPPEALIDPPIYTDKLDIFSLGAVMIQIMSRQYPNPGPAHRQLRTMLLQAIPEEERRLNHIKLINQGHQMLPLAKQCIQNSYHERPSSHDVCNTLRLLTESHDYQWSKDQESVERKLEKASQLHEARHQEELARIKVEYEAHYQRLQARYQVEIASITEQHNKDIQEQRANIEAAHLQELQQLRQLQHLRNSTPPLVLPSPLLQQRKPPIAHHLMPIPLPNSQDNYNLDKMIDKSQGRCIDSVKYIPDAATSGVLIPFDPSNLPEPAFDTHDLEIFHQEAHNLTDPYASGDMSLLINPRSDDLDDFSGPYLDDHLAYRCHDSGHIGMSESSTGSALRKLAEEKSESEQQQHEKESETCSSDDLDDFSGPYLDDHLAYRCHDSGHIGMSESSTGSALRKLAEEKSESEQQQHKKESETCSPDNHDIIVSIPDIPRTREACYEDVVIRQLPRPRCDEKFSKKGPPNSPIHKPVAEPRKPGSPYNKKSSTALSDLQTANKDIQPLQ